MSNKMHCLVFIPVTKSFLLKFICKQLQGLACEEKNVMDEYSGLAAQNLLPLLYMLHTVCDSFPISISISVFVEKEGWEVSLEVKLCKLRVNNKKAPTKLVTDKNMKWILFSWRTMEIPIIIKLEKFKNENKSSDYQFLKYNAERKPGTLSVSIQKTSKSWALRMEYITLLALLNEFHLGILFAKAKIFLIFCSLS